MFSTFIRRLGLSERTQPVNANPQSAANQIDAYFDSLLYPGMPLQDAVQIERQRTAAHATLTRAILAAELDGWRRPGLR